MKKTLPLFVSMILILNACAPSATASPASLPTSGPAASGKTQIPTAILPTEVNQSADWKLYENKSFGFSFQFPAKWSGPGEDVSDNTLRVEVGSDKVVPYGQQPEQPSDVKNSYNVVIQYTKNNQNSFWKDTYQSLQNLKDGESLSGARSLITRVRQIEIGGLKGFEYISTLPDTAKTDHVYIRQVTLVNEQTNDLLTIMGQPNNVEVSNGSQWRDVYQSIDKANLIFFHKIVESITISN